MYTCDCLLQGLENKEDENFNGRYNGDKRRGETGQLEWGRTAHSQYWSWLEARREGDHKDLHPPPITPSPHPSHTFLCHKATPSLSLIYKIIQQKTYPMKDSTR